MVRLKGLWFVVSVACYMTGVGGMIYCIIRNPKPHGFHQVRSCGRGDFEGGMSSTHERQTPRCSLFFSADRKRRVTSEI